MATTYRSVTPHVPEGLSGFRRGTESVIPVYLAVALLYFLFIPEQFNFRIFGVYLPPYRVFVMAGAIYLLAGAFSGRLRFAWPDLFIASAVAWVWLASYMTSGSIGTALVQGGAHTIDIALAYFLARVGIQSPRDLRLFLIASAPGLAIISATVVLEAITHVRIIQSAASAVTGQPMPLRGDTRMGLLRGAANFPHPILAGIFLASFLTIFLGSGIKGWPKLFGIFAAMGAFFSMSSAALLGLIFGALLWAYNWLTERFYNFSWRLLLAFSSVVYVIVETVSNTGTYGLLVRYASLNTASAYNRILIWKYGTENIERNPFFGIGYDDWDRPDWMHSGSFDHFWLIMALRFGIPASILLIFATLWGVYCVARNSESLGTVDRRLLRGVAIALAVFALGVNSVSLWLSALVWFFMLLGIAVSLGDYKQPRIIRYRWHVKNSSEKAST